MRLCHFLRKITCTVSFFLSIAALHAQGRNTKGLFVRNIQVVPLDSKTIEVSWSIPEQKDGNTIISFSVYRSSYPIINTESLALMQPIAKVNGTYISYRDKVPDNMDFYYAVIINSVECMNHSDTDKDNQNLYYDEQFDTIPNDNGSPFIVTIPGENTTVQAVHTSSEKQKTDNNHLAINKAQPKRRNAPVPYTNPLEERDYIDKKNIGGKQKISQETEEYVSRLIHQENPVKLERYIFSEDSISPKSGESLRLYELLKDTFRKERYVLSVISLTEFISQNRDSSETPELQRALFYLGESYYFTDNYQKALKCFIKVYDAYPSLAQKWIDSSLDFIR